MKRLISSLALLIPILNSIKGDIYRLPTHIKPIFYGIKLDVNVEDGEFIGNVYINLKIDCFNVNSIKLHVANLSINEILLDKEEAEFKLKPSDELVEVSYKNSSIISPGFHQIRVKYNGSLENKTNGFFKAQYTDPDGEVLSELAVTDFEPTYARGAFPCFDEPFFKAKFKISIIVRDENYTAISNMKNTQKFKISRGFFYKFQTSCLMSPYLVAFAIIPYNYVETTCKIDCRSIPIKIWSHNVTYNTSNTILGYASDSLKFFTDYFDYADPMPKIDFVDYDRSGSTATENWGLVTMMKGMLQKTPDSYTHTQIASTIAHELAHFWFGNLVTNEWWDDLWLQEAFAEYLSIKATKEILNQTASVQDVLSIEEIYFLEQSDTPPIVKTVRQIGEIEARFHDITYTKGAGILRMLEFVVGEDLFQEILRQYLKMFRFQTATTHDFLDIVEMNTEHLKGDIRTFLESYLYQNRYPVISVEEDLERNVYILRQQSCNNSRKDEFNYEYRWTVPVSYFTNLTKKNYSISWFDKDAETLIIPKGNESWIKFNFGDLGYYRVNYSESLREKLFFSDDASLTKREQVNLLMEVVHLFDADILSCEIPLKYFDLVIKRGLSPAVPMTYFWHQLEMGGFKNDKEALDILINYMKKIGRLQIDDESIRVRRSEFVSTLMSFIWRNETEINEETNISDKVQVCIDWIKTNLDSNEILQDNNNNKTSH